MPRTSKLGSRAGYSVVELLIACVMGVLVLSSALSLAMTTFRSMAGLQLRDGIDRNARYLGMVLQRDLTETGVDVEALAGSGTLAVWADTIAILRAKWDGPTNSSVPAYPVSNANMNQGVNNPGGTPTYVDISSATVPLMAVGDVVRYQKNSLRRLLLVNSITRVGTAYRIGFTPGTWLIHHAAGLAGGAPPAIGNPTSATVQALAMVMYYRNGTQLMRAQSLDVATNRPVGAVVAEGVQTFDAWLTFTNGVEALTADTTNAATSYNQIAGIRVRATMQAEATDFRVNNGALLTKQFEWFVAPRNLIYERNRI
jgi:hypothetical protein